MKCVARILMSTCLFVLMLVQESKAQSIINPSDPVLEYDPARPPTPPDYSHPIVKWVRTLNIAGGAVQSRNPGWNSDVYKAYSYNGLSFRVQFPKTYNPAINDGKKYPLIIFLHGQGENDQTYLGPPPPNGGSYNYDNQYQLLQGPPQFDAAIKSGQYDGYVLAPQLQNNSSSAPTTYYYGILNDILNIAKYMIANNKVDPFHIVVNGLSVGGVGVWDMLNSFPSYVSAAIPMSSPVDFVNWSNTGSYFSSKRFTPIWVTQGGVDVHPTPAETQRLADTMTKWGANFRESLYPDAGHSTWYQLWGERDFWPFVNNAYSSNPWMVGGPKTFVPGQIIDETLGITAGFSAYEWRKNGTVVPGATGNTLTVTAPGLYDARVQRDGVWSDWSHVPVNISTAFFEAENWTNMSGVQKEASTDAGGGDVVAYIDNGDWLDYNTTLVTAGSYAMRFRVASPNGGQLQVRNGAGTVLATISIPATGSWQNWQTVTASVTLPAGAQTLRLYAAAGGWNINWFDLTQGGSSTSTPPPPTSSSNRIEAENYTTMIGVQTESTTDAGGGLNVGYIDTGDWMDYTVSASSAGTYGLSFRIASPNGAQLQVKNSSGTVLSTVSIPATGGWQNWQTVSTNISLNAGAQTVRIYASAGGWNFNWMEIGSPTATPPPPPPSSTIHIEAENFTNMSGVQNENTNDVGGGQNVGYIDAGDWTDYNLTTPSAANFAMKLRIASPAGGQVQIRNSAGSVLATVSIPATGSYQTWQTVTTNLILPAGAQTVRLLAVTNGWNINWFDLDSIGSSGGSGGGGTTNNSTARIEAETYTTMSGIQKETTQDVGGGQNLAYIDAGDWMDYSVTTSTAGSFTVNFRLASPNTGGQLQLKNTAGTVLATVNVPTTGGWQTWQTVTTNITLPAGTQTLRIYDAAGGWNINWFELTGAGTITTSAPPPPSSTANHIEAENYSSMSGVQKEGTTDIGGGQNVGYIDTGDWMDYTVSVSSAASYGVNLRVSSPNGGQLQIKASNGTVLATVAIPKTGGWQNWQTVSTNISLNAGAQTVRIYASASGWNFNWFEFTGAGTVSAASTSRAELSSTSYPLQTGALNIYPNPVSSNMHLWINNSFTGPVTVQVYSLSGSLQKQFSLSKPETGSVQFSLFLGPITKGNYIIKVSMNNWTQSRQITKL